MRLLYWITGANGARISVDELVAFRYTAIRFSGHARRRMGSRHRSMMDGVHLIERINKAGEMARFGINV